MAKSWRTAFYGADGALDGWTAEFLPTYSGRRQSGWQATLYRAGARVDVTWHRTLPIARSWARDDHYKRTVPYRGP